MIFKRTNKLLLGSLFIMATLLLQNCTKEIFIDYNSAKVEVSRIQTEDLGSIKILFTPSENTVKYEYAIGEESDLSLFEEGKLENTITVENNEKTEVAFENLDINKIYSVFARAYNSEGDHGGTSNIKEKPFGGNQLTSDVSYITPTSASFRLMYSEEFYLCKYFIGKADDKEAFLNGEVEFETIGEIDKQYYINSFELKPSTDYVLYAIAINRAGGKSNLIEQSFSTPSKEEAPNVELEIVNMDAFKAKFKISSNKKCGKMTCIIHEKDYYDWELGLPYGPWKNNWMTFVKNRESMPSLSVSTESNTINLVVPDFTFPVDKQKEIWVLIYDEEKAEYGIQYFSVDMEKTDESRPKAKVEVKVSDITAKGATYTYTFDENTLGFYYETIDADWYDKIKKTEQWHEFYMHEYLKNYGAKYWIYAHEMDGEKFEYTEEGGKPGKRYYAVACPMNFNGPGLGWSPEILLEYTTLETK